MGGRVTQTCPEQKIKESPVLLAHPENCKSKNVIFGSDGDSSAGCLTGSQNSVPSPQAKQAALFPRFPSTPLRQNHSQRSSVLKMT